MTLIACSTSSGGRTTQDFAAFLDQVDRAQLALQRGNPSEYKALWSTQPDVTLAGGFGGEFEQGWEGVSKRLDWASSQFVNGRNQIRRISFGNGNDIGYLIQVERLTFNTPGQAAPVERTYRVSMLFRREHGDWRIIHRHADSQTEKAPPK